MKRERDDNLIFEYMLKIPKLKNDLITGEDSYNYTDRQYNDIMQDLQNQIDRAKLAIKDPKILDNKLNYLNFEKGELKIERIIHMKKKAKNSGDDVFKYDPKLLSIVHSQNRLLSLMNY